MPPRVSTIQKARGHWKGMLFLLGLLAVYVCATSNRGKPPLPPVPFIPPADPAVPVTFQGMKSCDNAACHGSPIASRSGIAKNEVVLWQQHDPHAKAHLTLGDGMSQEIILRLAEGNKDDKPRIRRIYEWCFRCHNTAIDDPPDSIVDRKAMTRYEGVGCEACHGPSSPWITSHWQSKADDPSTTGWREMVARDFAKLTKRVDTQAHETRAAVCTRCHVGQAGGEVNHDLIAAGHPVLKFEMSAYHREWPKHWSRADHPDQRTAALDWDMWQAGQKLSQVRALKVLGERTRVAGNSSHDAVCPEFSEYDCSACHHALAGGPRAERFLSATLRGSALARITPAWTSWPFARGRVSSDPAAAESCADLRVLMQSRVFPEKQEVARLTETACAQLLKPGRDDLETVLTSLRETNASATAADWDAATQLYFALLAVEISFGKDRAGHRERSAALRSLRDALGVVSVYRSRRKLPELFEPPQPKAGREIQAQIEFLLNESPLRKAKD